VGENPFVKGPKDWKYFQNIVEVQRIGVGKKAELPFSFLREDDLRDLLIFNKDIVPDGNELLKGKGELKKFF
jgi:hypothetical protein